MSPCYYPTRLHNLFSIATSADLRWVKLQGSMLLNIVDDKLKDGPDPSLLTRWTPAVFVACYPFGTPAFSLRAYAKRSFRMPTFNDLYYADMGNSALRPETATQYNVGVLYERQYRGGMLQSMRLQADAYRNYIDDKITAYPKGQQFRWTMMNLGKVRITGTDISADATLRLPAGIAMTTRLQYTYQDARDVTNRNDSYYNDQIAYIPYHSGSLMLGMKWRRWSANYSFIYTGLRYSQQENILYNRLQPWYTSDLNIMRTLTLGKTLMRVTLEINNLFSQDYDVILNYPMPKRNCAISLDIDM
jgi:outer membrane cobalamin receptor